MIAAIVINLFPYRDGAVTELLVAAHLPVVLWFVVAYPYMAGALRSHEPRMDFVRFTGEWFIYYVLIALGGGVLLALTALILEPIGAAWAERVVEWVLPSGAAGAVIVAAWLVESKQRVVENTLRFQLIGLTGPHVPGSQLGPGAASAPASALVRAPTPAPPAAGRRSRSPPRRTPAPPGWSQRNDVRADAQEPPADDTRADVVVPLVNDPAGMAVQEDTDLVISCDGEARGGKRRL